MTLDIHSMSEEESKTEFRIYKKVWCQPVGIRYNNGDLDIQIEI